jgi:hypothetical protein
MKLWPIDMTSYMAGRKSIAVDRERDTWRKLSVA